MLIEPADAENRNVSHFDPRFLAVTEHDVETKNTYHRADPAFSYLLALFLALTGLAWGLAYADGFGRTIHVALVFVLGHFLGISLLISTAMFFLVGRVLGKRRQGLFGPPVGGEEGLEFGYCFDVSGHLGQDYRSCCHCKRWSHEVALLLTNLVTGLNPSFPPSLGFPLRSAISTHAAHRPGLLGVEPFRQHHVPHGTKLLLHHYVPGLQWYVFRVTAALEMLTSIAALPFLSRTEILLAPIPVLVVIWFISLFTFDCATNLAPVLWCGVSLRKPV